VPVISSNMTCLPEVYGQAAEYFDPLRIDDMARAIKVVIDDPARQAELIRLGHKQVKKYSWEKSAQLLLKGYQKALKQ
ncbi:glycosyltransferase family 1 protein, partial [Candidatus Saccharibacteria bacterium]|nr:glycosyltransferase family 1 protein [Candidatus Saccharibacteria bacterium]